MAGDSSQSLRRIASSALCSAASHEPYNPQTGLEKLPALRVLYLSNNRLKDWGELGRLAGLPALEELLLAGNPLHTEYKDRGALPEYRIEVRHLSEV